MMTYPFDSAMVDAAEQLLASDAGRFIDSDPMDMVIAFGFVGRFYMTDLRIILRQLHKKLLKFF